MVWPSTASMTWLIRNPCVELQSTHPLEGSTGETWGMRHTEQPRHVARVDAKKCVRHEEEVTTPLRQLIVALRRSCDDGGTPTHERAIAHPTNLVNANFVTSTMEDRLYPRVRPDAYAFSHLRGR